MGRIVVIGGGLNGLSVAMLLALDGHDVTVLERDPAPPCDDPTEAWERWERRGVPQFRLPHFLLARWRHEAEQYLPSVVDELIARGGLRFHPLAQLPESVAGPRQAGDDRFATVTGRRPVVEAAFAAAAAKTYGVTVRRGVSVSSLIAAGPVADGIPHVTGVVTGDGERLEADLVIDVSGRRSPLCGWLEAIGARQLIEEREDSGFVYYARHYRSRDGQLPEALGPPLQDYESVSVLTLPADNATWSVAFITSARDAALRPLRTPERFDATLARYPLAAHWGAGEPISGIDVMAKLEDRYRRMVVDGEPVATGVLAVGDSWACTNPSLGRGITIGLLHACALRDVLREVPTSDPYKLSVRFDEVTEADVAPFYRLTRDYDRHRLAQIDADVAGVAYAPDDDGWAYTRALRTGAVASGDPAIVRAYLAVASLLDTPEHALALDGIAEKLIEMAPGLPDYPLPGLDRAELLRTVA